MYSFGLTRQPAGVPPRACATGRLPPARASARIPCDGRHVPAPRSHPEADRYPPAVVRQQGAIRYLAACGPAMRGWSKTRCCSCSVCVSLMPIIVKRNRLRNQRLPAILVSRLLRARAVPSGRHTNGTRTREGRRADESHKQGRSSRACGAVAPQGDAFAGSSLALAARLASTPSSQSLRMIGTAVTSCSVYGW
jgi:hypothetical protein